MGINKNRPRSFSVPARIRTRADGGGGATQGGRVGQKEVPVKGEGKALALNPQTSQGHIPFSRLREGALCLALHREL